ncbi:MAG: Trigger factor [Candidatus Falkowbacteria bacterium GW2011_GWC2_38_22]|uniref:Trigger factor n=1 Tax=Candidatus Falkowbacteria bacterium GW2011_GWE1_38_31 TaxID=1618638 RepID=A0A0G0JQI6_9BACT|nr:MAG: Trigger factor [Candidatus Falkowbacteria bacterium GW2011_GWF2_38_1205]KKQ60923.1 MAG: Trigger factor [Candidatus Falkowbacteria bacterium GW2011_GWC2_38_22]KKQ63041.1 MAG: Trigger factor [Candidatus Falkowbacteria bacterium GW2011_GWF1_38_22]KKQ65063.1 MAG: Trigger factor [Candidatus Falkowbacteria bacterium GW2011_GWE2_38_254]KKQ69838.1 MAG: Trigger factor [Candidatus Falkowbacteria bacterium GW2011_GWE1_38_31]KKQ72420.1 MAG: Trigger factor [Candidatus Falkowbacteria bacterium GW201
MNIEKKDLEKSQIELNIELTVEEFKPFIEKGAKKVSESVKVDGFRPGSVPYDILKQKVGEMAILEEAARLAISAKIGDIIKNNIEGDPVGQPKVDIVKLAPENPMCFKIVLAMLPKITLGEYKNFNIKARKADVSEEDVNKTLEEIKEMRVQEKIKEGEIADGDKVLADIQMFLDNVPLEGGQSREATIIIGKNYVVPGFDKNLLGLKKSETKEFALPYPKDHHMKNIAGKMVDFKITVKEIYERNLPELNDEFAASFGLKNYEELKTNITKGIEEHKKKDLNLATEKELLEKVLEKTKFGDLAEDLIRHEGDKMLAELEQTITQQGGKFEDYLKSIGKTEDQLTLDLLPDAIKRVKVSLMIREIGNTENIKTDGAEVDSQIEEMKKYYTEQSATNPEAKKALEHLGSPEYRSYVKNILNSRKTIDKLKEWNIVE